MSGLWEAGPKQRRGGAPRLYFWRTGMGSYLLAAAVEKGSRGTKSIKVAADRMKAIKRSGVPATVADARRILGREYDVRVAD